MDGLSGIEFPWKKGKASSKGTMEFLPKQGELLEKLRKIPDMTSVSVSINTEKTNVIMGKEVHTIWGKDTISDTIHVRNMKKEGYPLTGRKLSFHISPLSFYQVNPVQTEKLYSLALEYAGADGKGNSLGFVLRYWNHFPVSCGRGKEGMRRGNHFPGD